MDYCFCFIVVIVVEHHCRTEVAFEQSNNITATAAIITIVVYMLLAQMDPFITAAILGTSIIVIVMELVKFGMCSIIHSHLRVQRYLPYHFFTMAASLFRGYH